LNKVSIWMNTDITIKNGKHYDNPYLDTRVIGEFTSASGSKIRLFGFWNGNDEWVVRFAPTEIGIWKYYISFEDCDAYASGEIEATEYNGSNELFRHGFLRVSKNKRYLEYADGTPFFWLADTHWLGLGSRERLNESNSPLFETMFHGEAAYRRLQGYTVYQMNFFASASGDCTGVGTSNEGGDIWQGEKFELINPEFFKNCDERIDYLTSIGIVPCLGIDWGRYITGENVKGYERITSYIIARYSSYPVVWFVAGEFAGSKEWMLWNSIGNIFEREDAYGQVTTIHGCGENFIKNPETTTETLADVFRNEKWFDMVMIQTGHLPHLMNRNVWRYYYDLAPIKPIFEAEQAYEGIWEVREPITREQAYLAIMHGSFGVTYGAEGVWDATWDTNDKHQVIPPWWPIPWYDAILLPGATQMGYLRKGFEQLSWWRLEPGDYLRITNPLNTMAETVAKMAEDKSECAVYYTCWQDKEYSTDLFLKNMKLGDRYSAKWFNPITAEITDAGELTVDENGEALLPRRDVQLYDRLLILKRI